MKEISFEERYHRIYIPSQRSLKTLFLKVESKKAILSEYKFNGYHAEKLFNSFTYEGVNVENGELFYNDILDNLTTGHLNRKKVAEFENFLSDNFFEGQGVELIPYTKEVKELHIKIGAEKEQAIFNLGDGLQMLIILTWSFFNYEYSIIAIEEPELFVHPGLQIKLIEIFNNHPKAKNFIFFISTHSNHIIDSFNKSNDISIFTVKKQLDEKDKSNEKLPKFVIENVGFNNIDALALLGVNNSSVYLANCTIWVEGITDKLYLTQFINCYLDKENLKRNVKYLRCLGFKAGTHFSFVISGGDSIIYWDFDEKSIYEDGKKIIAKNLCGRAFVVVDNDNGKNIKRKKELKEILGMRFYELPVIEIENLLGYDTIVKTIRSFKTCQTLEISSFKVPTSKMIKEKRVGSLIDNFILKNFKGKNRKLFSVKASSRNNNVTVNNKVEFCTKSLKYITPQNLSPDAIKTVEKILDFVLEHNKR